MRIKASDVKAGMTIVCKYVNNGQPVIVATARVETWSSARKDLIITVDGLMNRYGNPEHVLSLNTRIEVI
jgi:hypothetical protein